jgi:hypothetical protein
MKSLALAQLARVVGVRAHTIEKPWLSSTPAVFPKVEYQKTALDIDPTTAYV